MDKLEKQKQTRIEETAKQLKEKQTREKEIVFNENLDNLDTVNNQKSESDTADENLITKKQLNAELKNFLEQVTKMLDDRLSPLLKCINQHGEAISQLTEILGEQK
ncbi:Hypothetical_protein [Hexamita inflata]|uniref:Hypothetical_protein n=1 Tax=Hexamita inflata TaxID=28002 RepID=A0AA86RSX8_9EUKA|nr:Hypothetical protein HINF_LOCUS65167 [Hexamita inflata]